VYIAGTNGYPLYEKNADIEEMWREIVWSHHQEEIDIKTEGPTVIEGY
jgi:hypothetical protein